MPKWMGWMMGGGMLLNGLASILSCFWGGGGGGGAEKAAEKTTDEFASLKTLYPKYTFSKVGDTYVCVTKDGKQIRGTSPEDLLNKLGGDNDGTGEIKTEIRDDLAEVKEEVTKFNKTYSNLFGIEIEAIEDKTDPNYKQYKVKTPGSTNIETGTVFRTISDLYAAVKDVKPADKKDDPPKTTTIDDLYKTNLPNGNTPVTAEGANLADIFKVGNIVGVYDDGEGIGDFPNAKVSAYDATKKEITLGNHKYKVVDQKDGKLYLQDTNPTKNTDTKQIYIVEIDSSGKYSIHQRPWLETTEGVGKSAH